MSLALVQADCKKALATLTHLTNDELDRIINNEEEIESILNNIDKTFLKEIETQKETLLAKNSSLAEYNLTKEPLLIEGRQKIEQLSQEGEALSKIIEEKMKAIRDKSGDISLETTLALLQTAASEMEEESEKVARKFLDNEIDLEEFLDRFLSQRKIMHTRLVKAEKMAKILSRDPTLSNVPNYVNAPPVNINSNYFPGINPAPMSSVPYPVGPMPMPMPGNLNYFQNHY